MSKPIVVACSMDVSFGGSLTPSPWHADAVGGRPPHHPEPTTAQIPSVMCGRPRRSKGDLVCARRGRVRSCVRPTLRGLMTAGPDAIRSLAPKQIYALEWRITLDGFFQAPGSTGLPR